MEFCWDCADSGTCEKWRRHREAGNAHDSFKSYQKLEADIAFVKSEGVQVYDSQQRAREALLRRLLDGFNEGRSKSYYCVASTVMEIPELEDALEEAATRSGSLAAKDRAGVIHSLLDGIALKNGYRLVLRK